tara:strand:- start:741 stop:956 length:216 start_codon:yes stop_codon:yes gene_type:complete
MPFGSGKRRKSKPEDKPKFTNPIVSRVLPTAAKAITGGFGLALGSFLGKKARKMLEIPKGKEIDTKFRGVR